MVNVDDSKKHPVEYLSTPGDPTANEYLSYYTEYVVAEHQQPQSQESYHHREARQLVEENGDILIDDRSDDGSAEEGILNSIGIGIRRKYQTKIRNLTDYEKGEIRDLILKRRQELGSQQLFNRFLDATVRQVV